MLLLEFFKDALYVIGAGVTAGIDGALRLVAELRGDEVAQTIQLYIAYAPEPPFNRGTPETAPVAVLESARHSVRVIAQMVRTIFPATCRLRLSSSASLACSSGRTA